MKTPEEALTFSLSDGGGRGDGAEGGAAWEGGVGPGHRHRVAHPRCRVNGSDWFICTEISVTQPDISVLSNTTREQRRKSCTYCEAE